MAIKRVLAVTFTICALLAALPARAGAQGQVALSGRVILQTRGTLPRFTVRLYPSRETKRPTLVTYTDSAGNFKFPAVDPGRYLLELYRGESLAYQKVLTVEKNQPPQSLVIPLKTR